MVGLTGLLGSGGLAALLGPLLLLAAPDVPAGITGPLAVFWGGGQTWAVEVDAERLWVAPGWRAPGPHGPLRYRLRRVAERPARDADGLPRPAHRWTVFERLDPAARRWTPLTAAPELPAEGQLFDEQHVVQFAGDTAGFMRFRRVREGAAARDRISALTLSLPGGAERPLPPDTPAALAWLKRTIPGLIEPCVDRPAGLLTLDTPGGITARWMALTGIDRCADRAHGLAIDPPPAERVRLTGARWTGERFAPDVGPVLDRVVDVRPHPDGQLALLLSGPSLPAGRLAHRDLARFDDPCTLRDLTLWRAGRTAPIGRVPGLTGARWLAPGDPFRAVIGQWFRPADAPPCHGPVATAPAPVGGHACRITEDGRPWAGPDDLAAAAWIVDDGPRVRLTVAVHDAERAAADGIELYLGPGRRPKRVHLGRDGLEIRGGRRTRRAIARQLDARFEPTERGYTGHFTLQRALLGRPPALTVRVDDSDPGISGAVRLWAAGAPIDGRNPRATPVEPAP